MSAYSHSPIFMAPPPFSAGDGLRTYIEREAVSMKTLLPQWTAFRQLVGSLSEKAGRETISLTSPEEFPDGFCRQDPLWRFRCSDDVPTTVHFRMGANARRGESASFSEQISSYSSRLIEQDQGYCEGGDVIPIFGTNLIFIGERQNISDEEVRTDAAGIEWFTDVMREFGFLVQRVPFHHVLHLTTCASYLGKADDGMHCVGLNPASVKPRVFQNFRIRVIETPEGEGWAANGVPIGEHTILQKGYPKFYQAVLDAGFSRERLHLVDLKEAEKTETSATCMVNDETLHPGLTKTAA